MIRRLVKDANRSPDSLYTLLTRCDPYRDLSRAAFDRVVAMLAGRYADSRIRAYDIDTVEELWEYMAPTTAASTPMTYEYEGRQYVVFAAGGHSWYYAQGIDDYLLAFALPDDG